MILLTGLDSVIESLYLEEELTDKNRDTNILVNPVDVTYKFGKTVIINHKYYQTDKLLKLVRNKNKVYSRVDYGIDGVKYCPYNHRINFNIIPSGEVVNLVNEYNYHEVDHYYKNGILYYPTPRIYYDYYVGKDMTALGYLLVQLGCDVSEVNDSMTMNYDVIKLRNGIIV